MMDYSKATNEQLWVIMRSDAECPLHLLEGVFNEALRRDMITHFILSVVRKRYVTSEHAQEVMDMSHEDVVQTGYLGATNAIQQFTPGKGTFSNLLFIKISQAFGKVVEHNMAKKRSGDTCSYQEEIDSSGETFEYYLTDEKTSVENQAINKVLLEQMLSLVNEKERAALDEFMKGYTYQEIADKFGAKKSTISERIQQAFIKMTGQRVNLRHYGMAERFKSVS